MVRGSSGTKPWLGPPYFGTTGNGAECPLHATSRCNPTIKHKVPERTQCTSPEDLVEFKRLQLTSRPSHYPKRQRLQPRPLNSTRILREERVFWSGYPTSLTLSKIYPWLLTSMLLYLSLTLTHFPRQPQTSCILLSLMVSVPQTCPLFPPDQPNPGRLISASHAVRNRVDSKLG